MCQHPGNPSDPKNPGPPKNNLAPETVSADETLQAQICRCCGVVTVSMGPMSLRFNLKSFEELRKLVVEVDSRLRSPPVQIPSVQA